MTLYEALYGQANFLREFIYYLLHPYTFIQLFSYSSENFEAFIQHSKQTGNSCLSTSLNNNSNNNNSNNNSNYGIIEIGQNTETSPEDLTRLAVIQTLVKDRQLTLV